MFQKVLDYITKYQMIGVGDTIVAGISGGADSVCLFTVLMMMREEKKLNVQVVHINHGIRVEASEDAKFVRDMCERNGVTFHLVEADITKIAKEQHLSEEEAGRTIRYQAFSNVLQELKEKDEISCKIAVAHNKNDRAETQLFHLFRGTGLKGLQGIPPVRDAIIRPLLCVERKEIEAFLKQRGISYCVDATNDEDTYTRNKIRHHILPFAEKEISEHTILHMSETAELAEEIEHYMEQAAKNYAAVCITKKEPNQVVVQVEPFLQADSIIQKYMIREILFFLIKSKQNITLVHTKDMISLFTKQVGKFIILPYGLSARRNYNEVVISKESENEVAAREEATLSYCADIVVPGNIVLPNLQRAEFTLLLADGEREFPEKTYTKWFDYDKIEKSFQIRTRQSGDYLTINTNMGRQSLKTYLINQKVRREERGQQLLLADGNHIVWVIGKRISQYYKVTEQTKTILQVQIKEEDSLQKRKDNTKWQNM